MLAEMNDTTFRLGNLHENSYEEIVTSDALLDPLDGVLRAQCAHVHRLARSSPSAAPTQRVTT